MKKLIVSVVAFLGLLCLLAAPALASAKTIYVTPSGKDDTHNIQAAFNAAVEAGPGSVVQLGAGHFYANNIVVQDFRGSFTGAGQGKTVIDTLRGLNPKAPGLAFPADAHGVLEPFPSFFAFGNVRVSGMTFDISAAHPAAKWNCNYTPTFSWSDNVGDVVLVTGSASTAFTHVGFVAHPGLAFGWPYNVDAAIEITGPVTIYPIQGYAFDWGPPVAGTDSVTACDFENMYLGVSALVFEGTLTVGGSPTAGNVFGNIGFCALGAQAGGGQKTTFTFNQVNGTSSGSLFGVYATQTDNTTGPNPAPSHFLIAHNAMQGCVDGVLTWHWYDVYDYPDGTGPLWPASYVISDNTISPEAGDGEGMIMEDDSLLAGNGRSLCALVSGNRIALDDTVYGGIDGCFVDDALVAHNMVSGSGLAGICIGCSFFGDTAKNSDTGWQIIGNDVSGMTASEAPIWLGPGTTDCTVIGGRAPTQVLDEGSGNTLINVTPVTASLVAPAPAMRASVGASPELGLMQRLHRIVRR